MQEATSTLRGLIGDTKNPGLVSGAQFALAELYFDDSLFVKAEEEFIKVTQLPGNDDIIGQAYWRAGDAAYRDKRFDSASDHLKNALKHSLPRSLVIEARILYGKSLMEAGHPNKAINEFQSLLNDKRYFDYHDQVMIEQAIAHHGREE